MSIGRFIAVIAAFLGFVAPLPCSAASITPEGNEVYVNVGRGFVRVTSDVQVGPNTRVLMRNGSTAIISYESGCMVRVGSPCVWRVSRPPCASPANFVDYVHGGGEAFPASHGVGHYEQARSRARNHTAGNRYSNEWQEPNTCSQPVAYDPPLTNPSPAPELLGSISSETLAVGGVLVAAGVGVALAGGGSSGPASP